VAGDHERAWKAFERASQSSLGASSVFLREPLFETLRGDARYPALLEKLRLKN